MKQAKIVRNKILPVSIKDIILADNNGMLLSEVVLVLREESINGLSSWFTSVGKSSSVIKIVQSTKDLGSDETFFNEIYETSFREKKSANVETKVIDIYAELREQYSDINFTEKDLEMFLTENLGKIKYYEMPIRIKFSHKDVNPRFLEYFIVTQRGSKKLGGKTTKNVWHDHVYKIDNNGNGIARTWYSQRSKYINHFHTIKNGIVESAQSSCYPNCEDAYGSPGVGPHTHSIIPNVERHVVIENGSVTENGTVYTLGDGAVWAGDVYYSPSTEEAFGDKKLTIGLRSNTVSNTKVKDLRFEESINSTLFRTDETESNKRYRPRKSYFSDAYVFRTLEDECSFIFSVDYEELLNSKASMRDFFDPSSGISFGVDVQKIKILRRRLRTNSRITESRDRAEEQVILEFEPSPVGRIEFSNRSFSIIEMNGFSFSEPGIRTFQVIDKTMRFKDSGIYQYGMEFVYIDKSTDRMLGLKKVLDGNTDKLKSFLHESCQEINTTTGRFSDRYVRKYSNRRDISDAISDYASILGIFKNAPNFSDFVRSLVSSTSVFSGSPEGILSFGNNIKFLSEKINKIVLEKTTGLKGMISANTKDVNISHRASKMSSIKHYFDEAYNASIPKNVGYDFLSPTRQEGKKPRTRKITSRTLANRGLRETKKYYKSKVRNNDSFFGLFPDNLEGAPPAAGDSIIDSEVTYFTPSFILYGEGKVFDNINRDISKSLGVEYNTLIVDTIYRKINNFSSLETGVGVSNKIRNLVSDRNIILLSEDIDIKGEPVDSCGELKEKQRFFKALSIGSGIERNFDLFEEEKSNLDERPKDQNLFLFSVLAAENLNVFGASINKFDVNKTKVSHNSLAKLPNQLKSLVYSSAKSPLVKTSQITRNSQPLKNMDNFGFVYMNYKNVIFVEFLSSLPLDSAGRRMVRGGTWEKLTTDKLASMKSGKFLCRISRPPLSGFNIRTANHLNLPIYNKYFVIDNGNVSSPPAKNIFADNRATVKKMYNNSVLNRSVVPCDVIHLRRKG